MSEEETFACLWLTNIITKSEKDKKNIKILLNLIDRLQRRNEVLKGTIDDLNSLYLEEKEKNKELDLENQALYESINCNDNNMLAREYQKLQESIKNLEDQKTYWEIRATEQEQIVEGLLIKEKFSKTNLEKTTREIFNKTLKDFISKDKIKDKIKELEEETKETFDKYGDMVENKAIQVLKKLL